MLLEPLHQNAVADVEALGGVNRVAARCAKGSYDAALRDRVLTRVSELGPE